MTLADDLKTAFARYGVDDGIELIDRTCRRLAAEGRRGFEPGAGAVDRLVSAFERAFVEVSDLGVVPDSVSRAVREAARAVAHEFVDDSGASLRAAVVPKLYCSAARFYSAIITVDVSPTDRQPVV